MASWLHDHRGRLRNRDQHVGLGSYPQDYQVILAQFLEQEGCWREWMSEDWQLPIEVVDAAPIYEDAMQMEADLDRYDLRVENAIQLARDWDSTHELADGLWQKMDDHRCREDLWDMGLLLMMVNHVEELADAMYQGRSVPPIIVIDGELADGRHRALAAKSLQLQELLVVDLTKLCESVSD